LEKLAEMDKVMCYEHNSTLGVKANTENMLNQCKENLCKKDLIIIELENRIKEIEMHY
jgi:hypothetical protein